jgi:GMP synthase (glutamine-hydrolysing)
LVLQHIACEPPGVYEDVMRERGASIIRVELDRGELLPEGPMSVNDDADLPWLTSEKRSIANAVRAGTPYFGACLGVQLLAASLGARVYAGPSPEVGLLTVRLTEDGATDPLFAGLPDDILALQWHGDTFDLPSGAVRLAGSDAYPNQAFRFGRAAYGVQFHLEVSPEMAAEWARVPEYGAYLDRVLGPGSLPGLLREFDAASPALMDHARVLFARWMDLAEARAAA